MAFRLPTARGMSDPLAPASHCAHAVPFYDLSFHLFVTIVHLLYLFGFCRTRPPHGSNRAVVLSALSVACLCLASHRYPSTILSFLTVGGTSMSGRAALDSHALLGRNCIYQKALKWSWVHCSTISDRSWSFLSLTWFYLYVIFYTFLLFYSERRISLWSTFTLVLCVLLSWLDSAPRHPLIYTFWGLCTYLDWGCT